MIELFKNKTVVISGGLGDIGRAMAIEFAKNGANVALCDIHPEAATIDLLTTIKNFGVQCSYNNVDVTDATVVKNWILEVENKLGVASLIIPNAAIVTLAGINEITPEQWLTEMRVNLDGAFHLAQAAIARLLHHKLPGRVLFIGSWAADKPHTHIPAYCVSKAGLRMLCKCLALELAPHDILVNELAPGFVAAGLSRSVWEKNPGEEEKALDKVPVKKVITPQQIAKQVMVLCHPDNEHTTGSTVLMDGGLSLLSD